MKAPRPRITAATRTADGARLDLDTGEALHVTPDAWATLTGAPPYVLMLGDPMTRALDVPSALLPQVAHCLDIASLDPHTAQGQAALMALGFAGPFPVPDGAMLGGYAHGTALTEREALTLAALPDYPEHWVICPCESGGAPFTLLWGNAASNEQLTRSSTWATLTAASLRASDTPRGSA